MSLQLGLKHLKQVREKKGQVAIEFIIVSVVVFFFLLFFLSFALVLVVSEYVEFATFMAARTLKAGHVSQTVQETNATGVFQSYMQRVGTLVRTTRVESLNVSKIVFSFITFKSLLEVS